MTNIGTNDHGHTRAAGEAMFRVAFATVYKPLKHRRTGKWVTPPVDFAALREEVKKKYRLADTSAAVEDQTKRRRG